MSSVIEFYGTCYKLKYIYLGVERVSGGPMICRRWLFLFFFFLLFSLFPLNYMFIYFPFVFIFSPYVFYYLFSSLTFLESFLCFQFNS